jgi:hypothetical protein
MHRLQAQTRTGRLEAQKNETEDVDNYAARMGAKDFKYTGSSVGLGGLNWNI